MWEVYREFGVQMIEKRSRKLTLFLTNGVEINVSHNQRDFVSILVKLITGNVRVNFIKR